MHTPAAICRHRKKLTITLICVSAEQAALKIHALANHPAVEKLIVIPFYETIKSGWRGVSVPVHWNADIFGVWPYQRKPDKTLPALQESALLGYDAKELLKHYRDDKAPTGLLASWPGSSPLQTNTHSTSRIKSQIQKILNHAGKRENELQMERVDRLLETLEADEKELYEPPKHFSAFSAEEIEASDLICTDVGAGFDVLPRLFPKGKFLNDPTTLEKLAEKTTLPALAEAIDADRPTSQHAFAPCQNVSTADDVCAFMEQHGSQIVLKERDSIQGRGIFKVEMDEERSLHLMKNGRDYYCAPSKWLEYSAPALAMKWLEPPKGDVRVLWLDGQIIGAYNRLPKKGSELCNRAQKGYPEPYVLSKTEEQMVKRVCAELKKHGQRWIGLDLMADTSGRRYVSEINLSNSGGLDTIHDYSLSHYGSRPAAELYANAIVAIARGETRQMSR